ncbi:MAG: nucleotidyltransferase [Actinomycetota bacterium]
MEQIEFPPDFSEFLKSLTDHGVEFLLVGGFAVALHGYPRATADMDVWIARRHDNAVRVVAALRAFGFDLPNLSPEIFEEPDRVVRMGQAPLRIEILTDIDGVEFGACASRSDTTTIDGTQIPVISLSDLKANKQACGRAKDLDDLENLP